MAEKKKFSFRQRAKSFLYAGRGIRFFLRSQHNAWIHLVAAVIAVGAGFYFKISKMEWVSLIIVIGLVLAAEAFNTAIEFLMDLVSPEFNEKAGKIKDIAAGAVLITAIAALIVGLIIFLPKFCALL